ncbi:MAG: toll/interleukin-1 receptor domain-containing protein [Lysobacterales bacterium]
MADVFVSYSSKDRQWVQSLTEALREVGLTIWWDRNLSPGNRFTNEMEAELEAASAVVVVWSQASVKSMWVADEASVGRDKGNLVPIAMEPVLPGMGFRQLHAIDFQRWRGDAHAAEFNQLVDTIAKMVAGERADYLNEAPPPAKPDSGKSPWVYVAVAALIAIFTLYWQYPFSDSGPASDDLSQSPDFEGSTDQNTPDANVGLAVIPFVS